jgi:hypothetical protein
MTRSHCACGDCRRTIRDTILAVFDEQGRWMGRWTIVAEDRSGLLRTIPEGLYKEILREMCGRDGGCLLMLSDGKGWDFPRMFPFALMDRPSSVPAGREGGGHVA